VKVGDWVDSVDGYWVIDGAQLQAFAQLQAKVASGKLPATAVLPLRKSLETKLEKSLTSLKARDRLMVGTQGVVSVVWHHGEFVRNAIIPKGRSDMQEPLTKDSITVPFVEGRAAKLANQIKGRDQVTIDLRNNVLGDFDDMAACLAILAPSGDYGELATYREGAGKRLVVHNGNAKPPKITLVVDQSTRGLAEIFATALTSKDLATLQGGSMAGDMTIVEAYGLPDGSGYTLATGEYIPPGSDRKLAMLSRPYRRDVYGSVQLDDPRAQPIAVASRVGKHQRRSF
jgi:hypothetical protein